MSTTSVDVIEPGEERLLDQQLDQELVDLAFWEIVNASWPPVVKTGTTLLDDAMEHRALGRQQSPSRDDRRWGSGCDPEERSPPISHHC